VEAGIPLLRSLRCRAPPTPPGQMPLHCATAFGPSERAAERALAGIEVPVRAPPEAPRRDLLIGWGTRLRESDGWDRATLREVEGWGLAKPVRDRAGPAHARAGPRAWPPPGALRMFDGGRAAEAAAGFSMVARLEAGSCLRLLGQPSCFSHHPPPAALPAAGANHALRAGRPPACNSLGDSSRHGPQHELTPATRLCLPELLAPCVGWCSGECMNWLAWRKVAPRLPWRRGGAGGPAEFTPLASSAWGGSQALDPACARLACLRW